MISRDWILQILLLLLFALGLWLNFLPDWPVVFIAVTAMTYFQKFARPIMITAGVYLWLFSNRLGWDALLRVANNLELPIFANLFLFKLAIVIITVLFCVFYIRLIFVSAFLRKLPLGFLFAFYVLIFSATMELPLTPTQKFWAWGFLLVFGKFFWFLAFAANDAKTKQHKLKLKGVLSFFPFWSDQAIPIPGGANFLNRCEAKTPAQLRFSQIRGLKLLYWSLVLKSGFYIIDAVAFGRQSFVARLLHLPSFYLPDPTINGLAILTAPPQSTLICWAVILAKSTSFLLYYGYYYGVFVAVARMAGFYIFRNMYRPLSATSFPNFWRRLMYYYSQLVVILFIIPFQSKFKKVSNPHQRFFLSCFTGIFFSAICYHFVRDTYYFGFLRVTDAAYMYLSQLPYYFTVAFCVSIVLAVGRKNNFWQRIPGGYILAPICYYLLACILWTIIYDFRYSGGSWETCYQLIFQLLGRGST